APWLFGFYAGGAETWVPVILGLGTIVYSLLTNYELSIRHMISMRTHLTLDVPSGILLAASPWLFGFASYVWEPHLIVGIIEIGVAAMTQKEPFAEKRRTTHTATLH